MAAFIDWKIWLIPIVCIAIPVSMLYPVWKSSFKSGKVSTAAAVLLIPFLINAVCFTVKGDYEALYKRNLETEMPVRYIDSRRSLNNLVSPVTDPRFPAENDIFPAKFTWRKDRHIGVRKPYCIDWNLAGKTFGGRSEKHFQSRAKSSFSKLPSDYFSS